MITVKQITTKKELKQFVTFPFQLDKDCQYWAPPLINDEMETFDVEKNPVFKNADATHFLAYKDGKIAGRISVIINYLEIDEIGKKKVRFGWLDMIDDIEVVSDFNNYPGILLAALFIWVLSHIFIRGLKLKEEQALTI